MRSAEPVLRWLVLGVSAGLSAATLYLTVLNRRSLQVMASTLNDVKNLVTAIDAETNAVAAKVDAQTAKITELQATIAAGGAVTAEDLQGLVDGLTPISARLTAIGADPATPIPPVEG